MDRLFIFDQITMHMRLSILIVLVAYSIPSFSQFKNIKLDEQTETNRVAEPSIAINHKDPNNIVAASILDNIYTTKNGGLTWKKIKVTSPSGVYGDPVLICTDKGTFYYFHLSDPTGEGWRNEKSLDHIVCHESNDGGETWDQGSIIGSNPPKDQDKPWASVDDKGNIYVTWTQFDKYNDSDPNCQSQILMSTSSNGKKWSKPFQISQTPGNCLDDDNTVEGAVPAIGFDGKMFVAWANQGKIFLDRSFDGKMWLSNDIAVTEQKGGWDMKVPGHDRCNGMPILMIDKSKSVQRGSLYLAFADQPNGEANTDVWFMRSMNYGDNWTTPIKIGKDSLSRHQYLPWMTVDQTTGFIYMVYYDRSNYEDNQTDVYLAFSNDAGASFKNVKISETPFTPTDTKFFGDYTNIYAHNGIITPIWARMDDGKTSVWTTIIKQDDLIKKVETAGKKKKK
ncbi:MAG TPA: sialidase family protein [Chryseolinea sp.]|nr:sialidase family protein [Chryseolinea sp.]